MKTDLTATQSDYAYFLPAVSGFYSTFIGKQRFSNYVDPARIPASFKNGMESLNFLDPDRGAFYYDHCLYSAGHANIDLSKPDPSEDMFRNRNRSNSWVLGDSGGFQIGKGKWPADWKDPNCPAAQLKRSQVLAWMDSFMDYGITLDIPAWVARSPAGQRATGISSYAEAVQGTYINNEYFINNRNGNCKFLNVLQGENHQDADDWYDRMKKYSDPKQYPGRHFNGWGMGGQNMCDVHLTLKRLVSLRFDGLLERGLHDWMHFLGTSKLEWAMLLTDIQRAVRKYHNDQFSISFDCASPFLATANGSIYTEAVYPDRKKWSYRMLPNMDDRKYHQDTRLFKDAVIQDGHFLKFDSSPIIDQVMTKEICIYGPNDVNKIGKLGKTSWDSFSYAIQMGHNVYLHVDIVQEANRRYDAGTYPNMLVASKLDGKRFNQYEHTYFREIVEAVFATSDRGRAEDIIEDYKSYWLGIPGSRGYLGVKSLNATTTFAKLFDEVDTSSVSSEDDFGDTEVERLDELQDSVKTQGE